MILIRIFNFLQAKQLDNTRQEKQLSNTSRWFQWTRLTPNMPDGSCEPSSLSVAVHQHPTVGQAEWAAYAAAAQASMQGWCQDLLGHSSVVG